MDEVGIDAESGQKIIAVDPKYYRPTEVDSLLGDATKAKEILGWKTKTSLKELTRIMVLSDWDKVKRRGF